MTTDRGAPSARVRDAGAIAPLPPVEGDRLAAEPAALVWGAALQVAASMASAHPSPVPAPWSMLVGRWLDEDERGAIRGLVTFEPGLEGHALTRRAVVEGSPAQPERRHEDLITMLIAPDAHSAECMYFDNDGQVVGFVAAWEDGGRGLVLASTPEDGGPRYRMAWRLEDADTLALEIDVEDAPPAGFKPHSGGRLRRAGS